MPPKLCQRRLALPHRARTDEDLLPVIAARVLDLRFGAAEAEFGDYKNRLPLEVAVDKQ